MSMHAPISPGASAKGLKPGAVYAVIVVISVIAFFAIMVGFREPTREAIEEFRSRSASPAMAVRDLPDSYDKLMRDTKYVPPAVQQPPPRAMMRAERSEEEKIREQARLDGIRRQILARTSDPAMVLGSVSGEGSGPGAQGRRGASESGSGALSFGGPSSQTSSGGGVGATNARDDANRQDEKRAFLDEERPDEAYVKRSLREPISPFQVNAGTVIPGVLLTAINSDLPGQIVGQVSQNVYDTVTGRYLLIPQGARMVGEYDSRVVYGQDRVLITWTRLLLPNGKSIGLESMSGTDGAGRSGVSDEVDSHFWRVLGSAVLGSVITAGVRIAEGGNQTFNPEPEQLAAEGAAEGVARVVTRYTDQNLNVQPTLRVRAGFRFNVLVNKDLVLERYEDRLGEGAP